MEKRKLRILSIQAHSRDCNYIVYQNKVTGLEAVSEGYVPSHLNLGGGDEVEIEIDVETGQILNWVPLTEDHILKIMKVSD